MFKFIGFMKDHVYKGRIAVVRFTIFEQGSQLFRRFGQVHEDAEEVKVDIEALLQLNKGFHKGDVLRKVHQFFVSHSVQGTEGYGLASSGRLCCIVGCRFIRVCFSHPVIASASGFSYTSSLKSCLFPLQTFSCGRSWSDSAIFGSPTCTNA